jgi:hypothetical protein
MAKQRKILTLSVKVRLAEAEERELPEGMVYVYDDSSRLLDSAALPTGARSDVDLELPAEWRGRAVRVLVGPAPKAEEDEEDNRPVWMAELLREQSELPEAPQPETLRRMGAVERRLRLDADKSVTQLVAYPQDWMKWFTCWCVVRGRLVKRVHMPDGTTQLWGVCSACVLIYEVDAFPLVIALLRDQDLFRLRDDLAEVLKPQHEIPPKRLIELRPRVWPPPPPPPPVESVRPLSKGASAGGSGNPGPADATLADLGAVLEAPSATMLRNALVELGPLVIPYLCLVPWFMYYFGKHLVTWTCTDERGYFQTIIPYTCGGDHPDLYFRAGQCINCQWHWLYHPGVRCHTHWNYPCGTEVVLETDDPSAIVCAPPEPVDPPPGVTSWILVNKIGGTLINSIGDDGLIGDDFVLPGGGKIRGAPFGGRLGFRISHSADIPKTQIRYYRWRYRKDGDAKWSEFGTPVALSTGRHYADYDLNQPLRPPTFPVYTLGPNSVASKTMYEFRPQLADLQAKAPAGHKYEWPIEPIGNDIYSARLDSPNLPGGPSSAVGKYWFKLEIYDDGGSQVMPGGTTFRFIVLTSNAGDTRLAAAPEIDNGGFVFPLDIDNRVCEATIDAPTIGSVGADPVCGFLRYSAGDKVELDFHALHPASSYGAAPANRATFSYTLWRGAGMINQISGEVGAKSVGNWKGDTNGNFSGEFKVTQLLGACTEAAFAETLHVYAKATNGWDRIEAYDAWDVWAFALAPEAP